MDMKNVLQKAVSGVLTGTLLCLLAGCVGEVYPGPGPVAYYDYDYYPDWNVYYYPGARVYYWNDEGRWRSGPGLPPRYHLREEQREHLRLHSREPWMERAPQRPQYEHREDRDFGRRRDRD